MVQITSRKFIEQEGNRILQVFRFAFILIGANLDSLIDNTTYFGCSNCQGQLCNFCFVRGNLIILGSRLVNFFSIMEVTCQLALAIVHLHRHHFSSQIIFSVIPLERMVFSETKLRFQLFRCVMHLILGVMS